MSNDPLITAELLARYLDGRCTDEEAGAVEQWYERIRHGETGTDIPELNQPAHLRRLEARIGAAEKELRKPYFFPRMEIRKYASAAAVVLIVLCGMYAYFRYGQTNTGEKGSLVTVKNTKKQIARRVLPDGSTVWLQPAATLRYASGSFATGEREVSLEGEAFFEVTPNPRRPFLVEAGNMRVRVLGTSFLVKAEPGRTDYEVAVMTGKVRVYGSEAGAASSAGLTLLPSEKAVFELETGEVKPLLAADTTDGVEGWKATSLTFDDERLAEVARRLEEKFGYRVKLEDPTLGNCLLKATFENHRLAEILETTAEMLELTYEIEGKTIFLKGQGCEKL